MGVFRLVWVTMHIPDGFINALASLAFVAVAVAVAVAAILAVREVGEC
ncbi:hypothetical protein [Protofrankia symbiont of Coriaria ruscifolia]|nr:hypothetical protein [Protofrankia symbiont of Coriaria ruscifolia]